MKMDKEDMKDKKMGMKFTPKEEKAEAKKAAKKKPMKKKC